MRKFRLTALLLCMAISASCTAENAETITTTETLASTTAVSAEAQTTTAETTTAAETTEATVITSKTEEKDSFADSTNGMTETEKINYILRRFKDFSYDYIDCKTVKDYVSGEYIEIEKYSEYMGENYTEKWYRITDGDILSMEQLESSMKEICTDKMIDFLDMENYYCEKDGFLYLSENAGNDGGVLGVDEVYIKSVDYPDDTTVILNMHAYGNAEYWELSEDFREDFTVTLKKSGNELLIDECDLNGISYITWVFAAPETVYEPTLLKEYSFDISCEEFPPYEEYTGIEILSEEQQRAFWNAYYFYTIFDIDTAEFFRFNHIDYNAKQNGFLYATGYSYDSVINGFKTVLSEEIVDSMLKEYNCANIDGEFYCGQGARGANIFFLDKLEFVAVEMSEEKAVFKINALYGDFDNEEVREYVEHNFEMILIDDNWIVTKFEFWK